MPPQRPSRRRKLRKYLQRSRTEISGELDMKAGFYHERHSRSAGELADDLVRAAKRRQIGRSWRSGLRPEKHVLALEELDGDPERERSINASGSENHSDVVPMIGAAGDFLAHQAGVEHGNQRHAGV